ncbi:hypothetical protein HYQ46_010736 [Verticillium longisporum]|nr:hypothetical protein HYQ46_010736 [Verticillium longisporum]
MRRDACLLHFLVALTDDAETGSNRIGRCRADELSAVAQTVPYEIKHQANVVPLEGELGLGLDKLADDGTSRATHFAESDSSSLHGAHILAPKDSLQVLEKASIFCGLVGCINIHNAVQGVDAAQTFGRVAAVGNELSDSGVHRMVNVVEMIRLKICRLTVSSVPRWDQ